MNTNESNHPVLKRTNKAFTPLELLDDPHIVTVTVSQAAAILGIAKSTAFKAYKATGFLLDGNQVPVLLCGSRTIVSIEHLRTALGHHNVHEQYAPLVANR